VALDIGIIKSKESCATKGIRMSRLFITYCHVPSSERIYDWMFEAFGPDQVMGGASLSRSEVTAAIEGSDAVLVVVDPVWLTPADDHGHRQLNEACKPLQVEVEIALQQKKEVIPLQVDHDRPYDKDLQYLPDSLREVLAKPVIIIQGGNNFSSAMSRQIAHLEKRFGLSRVARLPEAAPKRRSWHGERLRLGVMSVMPPPFSWINIPAGKVTLESGAGQPKTFDIPTFAIAKYPVTNGQFAKFIEADGYQQQRWWTAAGWEARKTGDLIFDEKESAFVSDDNPAWIRPQQWETFGFDDPHQPVTGVSWYEAVAFCRWLSETSGEEVTLPTEQQWQRAAQGDDERLYPWGNQWSGKRCSNAVGPVQALGFVKSMIKSVRGGPVPVQDYEGKGDSPFGVVDMAGNVWEWCLTDFTNDVTDVESTDVRGMRGGAWDIFNMNCFRTTYHQSELPSLRASNRGFRCVRLLA
jgi:formylglycine-generating enzyme required for sulfatase activity